MAVLSVNSSAGVRARLPTAPLATAGGLLAATVVVGTVDPSTQSVVPPCPVNALTGWWCPGCGLTRGVHRLLHGDVAGALHFNALLPIVLPLIVLLWVDWYAGSIGRRPPFQSRVPGWWPIPVIAVAVAFAVLRNLPGVHGLRG